MAQSAGMNIAEPISSAIRNVQFGVLSADEIKSLSVKRITAAVTFDTLGHPVPNGLYDLALGAAVRAPCTTCNLNQFRCPGHCGHIKLPVPVYNPTFMDQALRLLRAQCQYCHGLKMSKITTNIYSCKLRLIHHGLLKEAAEIEPIGVPTVVGSKENDNVESDDSHIKTQSIVQKREAYVKRALKETGVRKKSDRTQTRTEAVIEARRCVIKEFLSDMNKSRKCANCGGISPTFRKDRYIKIFKKSLSSKDKTLMIQKGIKTNAPIVEEIARKHALQAAKDKQDSRRLELDEGVADMGGEESEDNESLGADEDIAGGLLVDVSASSGKKAKKTNKKEDQGQSYVSSSEVLFSLERLFQKEQDILSHIYGPRSRRMGANVSAEMFFMRALLVPPNKFRPEAKMGDSIAEASVNSLYKGILSACDAINQITHEIKTGHGLEGRPARTYTTLQAAIVDLQNAVNSLIDRDRNPIQGAAGRRNEDGIKQRLEKKEGLFRKNMMGKRVNFAARSVISPDPNLNSNEIGVPPVFAKGLHYPEPVTNHNFAELKEAILNGPNKWPGATAVEDEHGRITHLAKKNYEERVAIGNQLLAPSAGMGYSGARSKKVYRHLSNGDVVVMNRQPTLHKPSMMVHRARVLPGERTIRMHYANCNTYNADFDGDEMNMHFPQNELARAEAAIIADADHQYLSATAGAPLRGLIQDHITICVLLCAKDSFFTRADYHNLIYAGLRPEDNHTTTGRLLTIPPAIHKPRFLWTGKQVITTLLKNIKPEAHAPVTFTSKSQTDAERWGKGSEEGDVVFKDGELLMGILDKRQIGPAGGGLINCIYEAYGPTAAGRVLSALGRLLTKLLHMWAHSCGVEDLILTAEGERNRRSALYAAEAVGLEVASKYVSLNNLELRPDNPELLRRLECVLRDDSKQHGLDQLTNATSRDVSSAVTLACLPRHLIKRFPANQMQLMTGTGAKGTPVNANLISCNLGQQVLEARRVPVMVSGKTLPCFRPFETSIRAGGYVVDRFLTGIRPQEYYFHTMAGREGLIDTAVKTSRSGYLQRCLIKGMEGLKVQYDTSVRDSDGSMVQFLYGEDGLETSRVRYLKDFRFSAENFRSVFESMDVRGQLSRLQNEEASKWNRDAAKRYRKTGDLGCMDPALSKWNPSRYAVTSESFYRAKKRYLDENPDRLIRDKKQNVGTGLSKKTFNALLDLKYLKSIVEPGEAVGVIAGQSVGEPSTQMTLNTFHLAGHSARNVTLGIPRLREIVMTASSSISTASMTLYMNKEISRPESERFAKGISRLSLAQIVDEVTVCEMYGRGVGHSHAKIYKMRLEFFPSETYCQEHAITVKDVERTIERKFLHRLSKLIRSLLKKKGHEKTVKASAKTDALPEIGKSSRTVQQHQGRSRGEMEEADEGDVVDDGEDDEDDGDDEHEDATDDKQKANRMMAASYANPDDGEEALADEDRRRDATPDSLERDESLGASPPANGSLGEASESESESMLSRCSKANAAEREQRILSKMDDVTSYRFDDARGQWCEVVFEYDAATPRMLMLNLVENASKDAVIQAIPGIKTCLATREKVAGKEQEVVLVDGSNMTALWEYQDVHDPNKMYTNDIAQILRLYGVEAARASIVREMSNVFCSHGISVDNRHLNLIADVMTRGGGYTAFNRMGLRSNSSPFMKMSFETTVGFLKDAVLEEDVDSLNNPSARIVVGKLNNVGTGSFDVLTPVV